MQSLPHPHRRSFAILQAALAVLLLAANLAPLAQLWIPIYFLVVDRSDVKLCVGETEIVSVYVFLEVSAADHYYYYGERIGTEVSNRQVASVSPELAVTTPGGYGGLTSRLLRLPKFRGAFINQPIDEYFTIEGLKAGTATITFTHQQARRSGFPRAAPQSVQVEVTDCYEAFQWGHGDDFPVKDICSLNRPFVLESKTNRQDIILGARISIEENSSALFFWPFPQLAANDPLRGYYVYVTKWVNTAIPPDGSPPLVDPGFTVGGGDYQVVIRGQGPTREGDFQLTGSYTEYHDNGFVVTAEEDTLIAFRPLPAGATCVESLP